MRMMRELGDDTISVECPSGNVDIIEPAVRYMYNNKHAQK
jgi:hypothetical protein